MNAIPEARPAARPRAWRRGGRVVPLAALLVAATLAACDGDNLFEGDADSYLPLTKLTLPEGITAGGELPISVQAIAPRGVSQISLRVSGALAFDTIIDVDPPTPTVVKVVEVPVPQALRATVAEVVAFAIDQVGFDGPATIATVGATGAPLVEILGAPAIIKQGQTSLSFVVKAESAEPLTQIEVTASGAFQAHKVIAVTSTKLPLEQPVTLDIPSPLQDTVVTIQAAVTDESKDVGHATEMINFEIAPPTVTVNAPETAWPGQRIEVEVQAHSLRKLTELRVELRNFAVYDTVIAVKPERVNVTEYVAIRLPADVEIPDEGMTPYVRVRAFAVDGSNAMGVSAADSMELLIGTPVDPTNNAPVINYVDPFSDAVPGGHYVDVRVSASGSRPIKQIITRWRGFVADSLDVLTFAPQDTFDVLPSRLNVVEDISVEAPCLWTDGELSLLVTVRDAADVLSEVHSTEIEVTANSSCAPPPPPEDEGDPDDGTSAGVTIGASKAGMDGAAWSGGFTGDAPAFPGTSYSSRTRQRRQQRSARRMRRR